MLFQLVHDSSNDFVSHHDRLANNSGGSLVSIDFGSVEGTVTEPSWIIKEKGRVFLRVFVDEVNHPVSHYRFDIARVKIFLYDNIFLCRVRKYDNKVFLPG